MKKLSFLSLAVMIGALTLLSSCSYEPEGNKPPTATMKFKQGFSARYAIYLVDTTKSGNNPDHINLIDSVKQNIEQKIIDTSKSKTDKFGVTKNHVAVGVTFINPIPPAPPGTAQDTDYFFQDVNGDLYRYNFGFSILNQFPALTQAIGSNVDVGWVLAGKLTASSGATWVAKNDTITLQFNNLPVYLLSQGEMMADTSFVVGAETIKARHARNTVTATAAGNLEVGTVILDSYYSTDINAVVCDFFRHVTLTGSLLNQQAAGKFKIMTSHN